MEKRTEATYVRAPHKSVSGRWRLGQRGGFGVEGFSRERAPGEMVVQAKLAGSDARSSFWSGTDLRLELDLGRKTGSDVESLPSFDESPLRVTGGEEGLRQSQGSIGIAGRESGGGSECVDRIREPALAQVELPERKVGCDHAGRNGKAVPEV